MKYILAILFTILGFINAFAPEWIENTNFMFSSICFCLGGILISYKKED